ncbi:ATP-binding cassette, subfamily C [Sphingomonas sp. YR710]|nr:ATP-binding cassette, subfamily C [Sphingomonas sp. YR710]
MVAVFSALLNLLYIAPTIYMFQIYDRVVPTRGTLTLAFLTLVLCFALITLSGLDLIRSRTLVWASNRLERLIAPMLLSALLHRTDQNRGSYVLREFDSVRGVIAGPGMLALLDAPWTPIYVALGWLIHPALGMLALAGSLLLIGVALLNERAIKGPARRANDAKALAYSSLDRSINLGETVRGLGMRRALVERHMGERQISAALVLPSSFRSAAYLSTTKFVRQLLQSLALGLGALLAVQGSISAGAIFAASLLVTRALAPMEQIVSAWRAIVQARNGWDHMRQLLAGEEGTFRHTLLPIPTGRMNVEAAVVVAPGSQRIIISGISFSLEPGESLGIIGASGAGKSTLARALTRAAPLASGTIRLDGVDLRDWDEAQLATHIGYAPQEPGLFPGTVKENIAQFDPLVAVDQVFVDDEVVEAARLAGAHDMIVRLPNGYDTLIDTGGAGLSVGQAARISLSRAFYRSPRYMVLDEPNASLDAEGETSLIAAMKRMKEDGVTLIVVAHRIGVLGNVDKLLLLKSGQIELFGPRDSVIRKIMEMQATIRPMPTAHAGERR